MEGQDWDVAEIPGYGLGRTDKRYDGWCLFTPDTSLCMHQLGRTIDGGGATAELSATTGVPGAPGVPGVPGVPGAPGVQGAPHCSPGLPT